MFMKRLIYDVRQCSYHIDASLWPKYVREFFGIIFR